MNLLILSQYFWPENFRINDVVDGLIERGHHVFVLTGRPNYPGGNLFRGYGYVYPLRQCHNGACVLRVPLVPRGRGGAMNLALNFLSFALTASIAGPMIVPDDIDAIIVFEPSPMTVGLPAMALKFFLGAPVLFWVQDLWPESLSATGAIRSPGILKAVEIMVRWLYKGCDRILVQSRAFIPAVTRLGTDPKKVYYLPNSAERLYRPVEVPTDAPERELMPEGFRITFAGNIGAAQDFNTIIEAAIQIKAQTDINIVVIGDGRMMTSVQKAIDRHGLHDTIHLLGRYPAERMPYFFALSDALLVTLKQDPIFALTIPSKIQSYLACGKPIVAALDGEGARVIETAGAGFTGNAQDPTKLADNILTMYRLSRTERELIGRKGRQLFEKHFERESLLDNLERWLSEVVD